MSGAVGQSLPIAAGVMVSPLPIVAVVIMLTGDRARSNVTAFLVSWFIVVGTAVLLVALVAGVATQHGGSSRPWVGWSKVALGAALLWLAVREWRQRPRTGKPPAEPSWMVAIEGCTPLKAAELGLLLGVINPENLLFVVSGGTTIASEAEGNLPAELVAALIFTIVGSLGVAVPVVVYLYAGERAADSLAELKAWMIHHNAAIMSALLLVIGANLVGDGITIL